MRLLDPHPLIDMCLRNAEQFKYDSQRTAVGCIRRCGNLRILVENILSSLPYHTINYGDILQLGDIVWLSQPQHIAPGIYNGRTILSVNPDVHSKEAGVIEFMHHAVQSMSGFWTLPHSTGEVH